MGDVMKKYKKLGIKIVCVLPLAIVLYSMKMESQKELKRVIQYLEDFKTDDNYVNLTRIGLDYEINDFDGDVLKKAIEETGVKYVRITDAFISDEELAYYPHYYAVNYDDVVCVDNNRDILYAMYEPILSLDENGEIYYNIPYGYVLEEAQEIATPITLDELNNKEVDVIESEDSYRLILK